MARPRSTDTDVEQGEKEGAVEYSDDSVEYVDKGDYWEIHDKRLGNDVVSTAPKTLRDVPLPEKEQKKLEERIKAENEAEDVRKEAAEAQPEAPPVKDEEDESLTGTRGAGAKTEAKS